MTLTVVVLDMQPIDPPVGGGRLRLLGLYRDLGPDIHADYVGTFDWPGPEFRQQDISERLKETLVPLGAAHFAAAAARSQAVGGKVVIDTTFHELAHLSPDFVSTARAAAKRGDVVVMSHPWVYPLVRDVVDTTRQPLVYDAQNVEGVLRASMLDDGGGPGTNVVRGVVEIEHALCHAADLVLVCSREDADAFVRVYDVAPEKIRLVPNGAFTNEIRPASREAKAASRAALGIGTAPLAFFVGSQYGPNLDAGRFIVGQLAPALPDVMFVVGGGVSEALRDGLSAANVRLTGPLSEADKWAWLAAADLAINPMFGGSGTNIKMLEFMAAGLPIVTTPIGARGIGTAKEAFVVAEALEFPTAVARLTGDPPRRATLGDEARREAERSYSWERISPMVGRILSRRARTLGRRPFFSIVILSRGSHCALSGFLRLLEKQAFSDFEVVIADRGNAPWIQADKEWKFEIFYFHDPDSGDNDARNHGADLACGTVLAFAEEDSEPGPGWLDGMASLFDRPDLAAAHNLTADDANVVVRAAAFYAVGGFRPSTVGDDLVWRLQRHGYVAPISGNHTLRSAAARRPDAVPRPLRLAWVSTWNVPCGVARYSQYLVEALPKGIVEKLTIFADNRSTKLTSDTVNVVPSWAIDDRGIGQLADAVSDEAPDALVVQHHPGLISWEGLAELLTDPRVTNRPVVLTLHNVQNLTESGLAERSAVVHALQRATFLLVHSFRDLAMLGKIGLTRKVRLFPQGAPVTRLGPPVRVLPPDAAPRIGCFGFFFPHKGIYQLIQAAAIMRRTWPDLRLRLVNAAYPREDSTREIARCRALVTQLGVDGMVEWITDFLPEEQVLDLLGECDVVALPYADTEEASSAALRMALASGVPVAVTRISIFDEAEGVVARLKSDCPGDIAEGLNALLRDRLHRQYLPVLAKRWASQRAWPLMALRLSRLLHS